MNQTTQDILAIEEALIKSSLPFNVEIKAVIYSSNLNEMIEFAASAGRHLYEPFELIDNDYYEVVYRSDRNRQIEIRIKSRTKYKITKKIEEL